MIDQSAAFSQALQQFFLEWRGVAYHISLAGKLEQFFADLKAAPFKNEINILEKRPLFVESVIQVFSALRAPMENARARGELMNVWDIAGLRRDELRHARVLEWLLDCGASHGQQHRFLEQLLLRWTPKLPPDFPLPTCLLGGYFTRVEAYPLGNTENRIDIEIESETFLIFIEVKIDALEGPDQLKRYLKLANLKAAGRPFCVVFLSSVPQSATNEERICRVTWRDVAASINAVVQNTAGLESGLFLTELLKQLARHFSRL